MSFPKTVRRRLSDEPVRKSVADILEDSPLCSMATIGPRGQAHINTAYFAYSPRLEVFFLSDPTSLHCRNVARNPAMAMTYARRFPPYAKWMRGPTAQEKREAEQLRSYTFYRFVPSRVKILNEPVFGGGVFVVTAIPR